MSFEIQASSPGKIILHGEHSVVYGRTALALSLSSLRTRVSLKARPVLSSESSSSASVPHLSLSFLDLHPSFSLIMSRTELSNLLLHVSSCSSGSSSLWSRLSIIFDNTGTQSFFYLLLSLVSSDVLLSTSFEVTVKSDIPIGAGLGSSAAYNVSLSAALLSFASFDSYQIKEYSELSVKKEIEKEAFNHEFSPLELETICKWGYAAEKFMHGNPSGIDNTICTYGGLLSFKDGVSHPFVVSDSCQLKILLINSRISRNTRKLVELVKEKMNCFPIVTSTILEAIEHISLSSLNTLQKLENKIGKTSLHYKTLEDLITMNQGLLSALGVSHPSLDQIISISSSFGIQAKLTGAGGGGFALALLTPETSYSSVEALKSKLNSLGYQILETEIGGSGVHLFS